MKIYYVIPGSVRETPAEGFKSKFFPNLDEAREYAHLHARWLAESFQEMARIAILSINTGDLTEYSLCDAVNSEGCWWQDEAIVETIKAKRCGRCPGCISAFGAHRCKSPELCIEPIRRPAAA